MTDMHTRQSSTQSDKHQMTHRCSYFSWWWAHSRPKHVERRNKHTKKNCVTTWRYLQDYTGMHGQQNIKIITFIQKLALRMWGETNTHNRYDTRSLYKDLKQVSCNTNHKYQQRHWDVPCVCCLTAQPLWGTFWAAFYTLTHGQSVVTIKRLCGIRSSGTSRFLKG
jgi:hypothetical protein